MKSILERLFAEIVSEARANQRFGERLAGVLGTAAGSQRPAERQVTNRARNRRERGALDPYVEFSRGEAHLRGQLANLTVEQLKDIVSEHALDSSRLALKWKSQERLLELIVSTVRGRIEKGDVFRQ